MWFVKSATDIVNNDAAQKRRLRFLKSWIEACAQLLKQAFQLYVVMETRYLISNRQDGLTNHEAAAEGVLQSICNQF